MIGLLEGTPIIRGTQPIILLAGGVGYEVHVTSLYKNDNVEATNVRLFVYTHVKQDILELYGFAAEKELHLFKLLLKVSGIGPRSALLILEFGVDAVTRAVANADVGFFKQIPKIGKKNAQKIIIELKTKIGSVTELDLGEAQAGETNDMLQALASMGFSSKEAQAMIRSIPAELESIEERIRYALRKIH